MHSHCFLAVAMPNEQQLQEGHGASDQGKSSAAAASSGGKGSNPSQNLQFFPEEDYDVEHLCYASRGAAARALLRCWA
eukprot:1562621-Pyramimonas_sp.AAC.1